LDVYGLLSGQTATSTVMSTNANPTYGQNVTLYATVTSGTGTPTGSVNFFQKNGTNLQGVSALTGDQASISVSGLIPGTYTYNASYNGSGTYAVSWNSITFGVAKAPTTSTITGASPNPSNYGQPVTFTATVTSAAGTPTGSVQFKKGNGILGTGTLSSGVASYTTTATQLGGGTDVITANYVASADFAASTSSGYSQTVDPIASSAAGSSTPNPSTAGQQVTFTATVTAAVGTPAGNVIFKSGNTNLGTAALVSGVATLNYTFKNAGTYPVKAAYQGSANYQPSSVTITQTVN
jgi:hypothetical protein